MSTAVTIPIVAEHIETDLEAGEADGVTFWEQHPTNGYLYGVTFVAGDVPAQLLKVNKNDFTDRSVVDFANDGAHTKARGIVYAASNDRFYVLFGGDDYTITEVHPGTLARTDKATKTGAIALIDGLTTDDTSLYVLSQSGGSKIAAYNLSTFAETIADISAYATGTALKHFNGHLYAVQVSPDYKLLKITFSPLAVVATAFPGTPGAVNQQDFLALNNQYALVALQDTGRIWQFNLSTLAATSVAVTLSGVHIRLIYDGEYFWDLLDSGIAVRIVPATLQKESYSLTTGYLSGLVGDEDYLYGVNDDSPTTVARYRVVPYGTFRWVVLPNSGTSEYINAVAFDPDGNVVFGGSSGGGPYIQVNKYSSDGVLIWEKRYGAGVAYGVATDSVGNVYVCGQYMGSADFGGNTAPLAGVGFGDIFVLKLRASDGYALWAAGFVGPLEESARAIAVDNDDNVLVTGFFAGSVNFGGGARAASGDTDIFVLKLRGSDGEWIWDKTFGGNSSGLTDVGYGIAADPSNNACVVGAVVGPASLGGQTFTNNKAAIFVAKFAAADGAHIWSRVISATTQAIGYCVSTFTNGDVAVGGFIFGSADPGNGVPLVSTGRQDIFLARYASADGAYVWAKNYGGAYELTDAVYAITVDHSDRLYSTGQYVGTLNLGAGNISGEGLYTYIARFDPTTGVAIWSKPLGGRSNTLGRGITANANGVVTGGIWSDGVDFGDGVARQGSGGADTFLLKLTT